MGLRTITDTTPVGFVASHQLPASQAVIASGDYKSTDPTPVELTPPIGARLAEVVLVVTAQSGAGNTVTMNVEKWDPASSTWVAMGTAPTYTAAAAGSLRIIVNPDLAAAAGPPAILQSVLGETLRVRPVGTGTRTTLNYSVSAHWSY